VNRPDRASAWGHEAPRGGKRAELGWRLCPGCGATFAPLHREHRYCTYACHERAKLGAQPRRHGYHDVTLQSGDAPQLIDHAPLLHATCERLEAALERVPAAKRATWLAQQPLTHQAGYRDFPWLVRTLLTQKLKLA